MCLWIDSDDYTFLNDGWRTARKGHGCYECRRTIEPGERYLFQDSVDRYNNQVVTWKMCAHCYAVVEAGCALTGCPPRWYWGAMLGTSDDGQGFVGDILLHDLPPGGVVRMLRLVVAARRRWRDRDGGLLPVPEVA